MRNIKDSTFPENILEEIGINKVSEKKIDYSRLTDDQVCHITDEAQGQYNFIVPL